LYWKDLDVWKKSHELVLNIYQETAKFPDTEKYAITNQIKRAAQSVPANIVEGHSRHSSKEFIHFLYQARGSLEELRYFILLSNDLKYLSQNAYGKLEKDALVINKMLNSLITSIKRKIK
jgi:four helix bundle protein